MKLRQLSQMIAIRSQLVNVQSNGNRYFMSLLTCFSFFLKVNFVEKNNNSYKNTWFMKSYSF